MIDSRLLLGALLGATLLVACSDDNAVRSPDLPEPRLSGIGAVTCDPAGLSVGQTATCTLASCTVQTVRPNGSVVTDNDAICPDGATFSSSAPTIASSTSDGVVTGVSTGTTNIVASLGGFTSSTSLVVDDACIESLSITPLNAQLVAGRSLLYTAEARFSDSDTDDVTANTAFASSDPTVASFQANRAIADADVAVETTVTVTATFQGTAQACGATVTASTPLTVRPAQLLANDGLCIETVPPAEAFAGGCRADRGACDDATPIALNLGGASRQLQIRGRYDDGLECDVTADTALTLDATGVVTLSPEAVLTAVAAGTTGINAALDNRTAERDVVVSVDQVLGDSSLAVSAKLRPGGDAVTFNNAQRFACVGANDLVNGLGTGVLRGQLPVHAFAGTCAANRIDPETGRCTLPPVFDEGVEVTPAFEDQPLENNVTNLMPADPNDAFNDGIVWRSTTGFWNGETCQQSSAGSADAPPTALVGDLFVEGERTLRTSNGIPLGAADQANGLVFADGALGLGFSCITAEYSNPQLASNTVVDGMTVLVLPVTNDALLGSSSESARLCDALAPAFSSPVLGVLEGTPLEGLGRLELVNTLNAITEVVNPVLDQVEGGLPLDPILTTLLDGNPDAGIPGLTDLTGLIVGALESPVVDPLDELVCQITSGVSSLLDLLSGGNGGGGQDCE